MKRTYQPKVRKRKKNHGFRKRMSSTAGRMIIKEEELKAEETIGIKQVDKMKKASRIRRNSEYQHVFATGSSLATRALVLYQLPNASQENRTGFIVSKKVGNAVTRNRVKRLLKETYRLHAADLVQGNDLVFIARPRAASLDYLQAATAMKQILIRGGLFSVKE